MSQLPLAKASYDARTASPIRRLAAAVLVQAFEALECPKEREEVLEFFRSPLAQLYADAAGMELDLARAVGRFEAKPKRQLRYQMADLEGPPARYRCPCGAPHNYRGTNGLCMACYSKQKCSSN